ncbi:peroxide stress protein YaaA [Mumia sp. zg.B53]|uniref:YaaA family protein n=1 Tax=unclassified Mumia TaxID=2621872 RepID=UPI001C6ECEB1|nr:MULTISPECIES: peroxide stress protein YaaA [unclassified Mumia]MBW9206369.1 peroxide stress protein YaaA [Mumia sp. zg.B17]MBW9215916.1 peroxide stress protein YaaA [Mumia sp. zg.B53]
MLVLLPPSEGKSVPRRGRPLDLSTLSFPTLTPTRRRIADTLVDLCTRDPARAAAVLGLGPTQADALARDASLWTEPTARADSVYDGVLYAALDLGTLDPAARRRASRSLAFASALFGLVRPTDRIPAYRLSGNVTLPGLGTIASQWRDELGPVVADTLGSGLLIDLRSSTYAALWRPDGPKDRVATVRVLHESNGRRSVVSHFNKATKGRIVRALLREGASPATVSALAADLRDLGWTVEQHAGRLDVVVTEV